LAKELQQPSFDMAQQVHMVMGFPRRHYFFSPPHDARVLSMRPQKTFDDPTFAACQIEALEPLINMAYKDFFNGSVLGLNPVVFLAFYE